jgi:predicted enzyme related to lactoylglutathione lyase
VRIVQVTPPGSGCSIGFGTGVPAYQGTPGTVRALHLVVDGLEAAREELLSRGVEMGEIEDVGGGVRYAGFTDPNGNTLTLQEMSWRTGESF